MAGNAPALTINPQWLNPLTSLLEMLRRGSSVWLLWCWWLESVCHSTRITERGENTRSPVQRSHISRGAAALGWFPLHSTSFPSDTESPLHMLLTAAFGGVTVGGDRILQQPNIGPRPGWRFSVSWAGLSTLLVNFPTALEPAWHTVSTCAQPGPHFDSWTGDKEKKPSVPFCPCPLSPSWFQESWFFSEVFRETWGTGRLFQVGLRPLVPQQGGTGPDAELGARAIGKESVPGNRREAAVYQPLKIKGSSE